MNVSRGNLLLIGNDSDSDSDEKETSNDPQKFPTQSTPSSSKNIIHTEANVETKKSGFSKTNEISQEKTNQSNATSGPEKVPKSKQEVVTGAVPGRNSTQSKPGLPYTDTVTVNKVDLCLLEHSKFGQDMENCDLEFDTDNGAVTIHTTDEDTCTAIKLTFYETLSTLVRERCKISPCIMVVLKREHGQSYMKQKMTQMKDAYIYLSTNEDGDNLCTVAFSDRVAEDAIQSVKSEISTEKIPFTDGHIHFLGSSGWETLKTEIMDESLVDVDISMASKEVLIEGIGTDVKNAAGRIKAVLQKKGSNKPLVLSGGLGRCFLNCRDMKQEFEELQRKIRQTDGRLEIHSQDGDVTLIMSGLDSNQERDISLLVKRIVKGKLDIKKISTSKSEKDEDKVLLCRCLQSRKGAEFMRRFEIDHSIGADIITTDTIVKEARLPTKSLVESASASSSDPESEQDELEYAIQVGRVAITVKQGNIVDEKAQVLVNFLEESSLWRYGALAKQFVNQGGDEIRTIFEDAYDETSLVVPTKSTGRLTNKCNHVCHIVLPKWKGNDSKESLETAMTELYDTVKRLSATSISMSAVGTGKILRYPGTVVAQVLVRAAVKVAQEKTKLQAITFVIYEEKDVSKFIEKLKSCHSELLETRTSFSFLFGPRSREIPEPIRIIHHQPLASAKRKGATAKPRTKQTRHSSSGVEVSDTTTESVKMVEVVLYASSKKTLDKTMGLLSKEMRDAFLTQETIKIKTSELRKETRKQILSQGDGKSVQIKIVAGDSKISIKGEKEDLLIVCNEIRKILLNQQDDVEFSSKRNTWKPKNKKGSERYWEELSKNHTTAPYWKKFKSGAYISTLMSKFKGAERCVVYQVDTRSRKVVEELVMKTWDNTKVCQGRDAVGLSHQSISITNVERIENLDLREKYLVERNALIRKLQDLGIQHFTPLQQILGAKGDILTTKVMDDLLKNDMHSEINEHFLFHGTKAEYVDNIAHKGVDHKKGNDHVMFGSGIYCAESSTKADQYADDKGRRTNTGLKILLVRLLMGEMYVTDQPNSFKHPPCTTCHNERCHDSSHKYFDSVVADGKWLFREFIVYDAAKCYPEYIITYDRV